MSSQKRQKKSADLALELHYRKELDKDKLNEETREHAQTLAELLKCREDIAEKRDLVVEMQSQIEEISNDLKTVRDELAEKTIELQHSKEVIAELEMSKVKLNEETRKHAQTIEELVQCREDIAEKRDLVLEMQNQVEEIESKYDSKINALKEIIKLYESNGAEVALSPRFPIMSELAKTGTTIFSEQKKLQAVLAELESERAQVIQQCADIYREKRRLLTLLQETKGLASDREANLSTDAYLDIATTTMRLRDLESQYLETSSRLAKNHSVSLQVQKDLDFANKSLSEQLENNKLAGNELLKQKTLLEQDLRTQNADINSLHRQLEALAQESSPIAIALQQELQGKLDSLQQDKWQTEAKLVATDARLPEASRIQENLHQLMTILSDSSNVERQLGITDNYLTLSGDGLADRGKTALLHTELRASRLEVAVLKSTVKSLESQMTSEALAEVLRSPQKQTAEFFPPTRSNYSPITSLGRYPAENNIDELLASLSDDNTTLERKTADPCKQENFFLKKGL